MRLVRGIISTTHIDLQNERFTLGALQSMVEQANAQYIPLNIEHDIRIPAAGRMTKSELVRLDDGEYGVVSTSEIFEPGDSLDTVIGDGRKLVIHDTVPETLAVEYDRMLPAEGRGLLAELATLCDEPPREQGKKAAEPVSILVLVLGPVLMGALAKAGADGWDRLKALSSTLSRHFRKTSVADTVVLDARTVIYVDGEPVEVNMYISHRSPRRVRRDIGKAIESGLELVEERLSSLPLKQARVRRIVFEYDGHNVSLAYAVRDDSVPMTFIGGKAVLLPHPDPDRLAPGG